MVNSYDTKEKGGDISRKGSFCVLIKEVKRRDDRGEVSPEVVANINKYLLLLVDLQSTVVRMYPYSDKRSKGMSMYTGFSISFFSTGVTVPILKRSSL